MYGGKYIHILHGESGQSANQSLIQNLRIPCGQNPLILKEAHSKLPSLKLT